MAKKRFELCVYSVGDICLSQETFEGTESAMRKRAVQLATQGSVKAFEYNRWDELERLPCDRWSHKPAEPVDALDPMPLAKIAFPDWRGRKATLVRRDVVELIGTFWDGGSKSTFRAVNISTGETSDAMPGMDTPREFGGKAANQAVRIPVGFAIVEHIVFCGKELGCRVFVPNENAIEKSGEYLTGTVV